VKLGGEAARANTGQHNCSVGVSEKTVAVGAGCRAQQGLWRG